VFRDKKVVAQQVLHLGSLVLPCSETLFLSVLNRFVDFSEFWREEAECGCHLTYPGRNRSIKA